ncbi:MAG: patatin-like phospholipase family protein [Bacilli bacterium]|jgi:NTE family protein
MRKLGICLSGGGGRGAYQIGALVALKELGILDKASYYSGTSIGSVNAVMVATSSLENARDIWLNIPEDSLKKNENFFKELREVGYKFPKSGLYEMDLLEEILIENVDIDKLNVEDIFVAIGYGGDSEKGFRLIKNTYKHYIKKESRIIYKSLKNLNQKDAIEAVRMSCSIPIVFPSVIKDGKKYYDGGIYDNVPVEPLVKAGCEEIIVIHLHKIHFFRPKKYPKVVFHEIKHKGLMGSILNFTKEHSQKLYQYGYDDVMNYYNKKEK